jgi:hypothetical protein
VLGRRVSWIVLVVLATSHGCIRRDGRNSTCRWPGETSRHPASPSHLSADAEFAEDLAIRYADTHYGLRTPNYVSGEVYGSERDRCMNSLFHQIAVQHGIPVELVSSALGRNRARIDAAVNVPVGLCYLFATWLGVQLIWRKYPPAEHGWIPGTILALFVALMMAGGCVMAGEVWSSFAETYRIGNGHMSYRAGRLWWARHRFELFVSALAVFCLAAGAAAHRSPRTAPDEKAGHLHLYQ